MRNRALVVWILVIVAMALLAGCGGGGGGGSDAPGDTTAPAVSSTSPANGSAGVAMNSSIAATFSKGMNASTINGTTFTLSGGSGSVSGTVTCNGSTATFTPSSNLNYSTTYTATITTGAKDAAGNAVASNYTWTFITGTGATFKIPDTGQTTSYTNTFGEDHDYTINPPSYTDNENGTITDNVTSLMWQKEDDNTERTWYDAVSYCDALALGGNSGWRLPTKRELISIVDYGKYNPAINTTFFPNTDSYYWSSTTYSTNGAWMVLFSSGYLNTPSKSNPFYVRCARGDGEPIAKSVTNSGNGTITDNVTGLMWQEAQGGSMTWEAGLTYCENLSLTGYNDWRLPNIKELESISGNGLNSSGYFWSSTTDMQKTTAAWRLYSDAYVWDGTNSIKQDSNNIRCVRSGQVSAPDVTPPTVTSTNPANNATGVAVNSAITATFSEAMDSSTVTAATFTLKQGTTAIVGTVTYTGTTATFTPSSSLADSTTYTATITTDVEDAAGNAMASNYTWSFTTGTAPDTTPPTVSSTSPTNNATGIAINSAITATFSETMDSSTVSTSTFTLKQGTTAIVGTVNYNGTTATFTPSSSLSYSTTFTATVTTGVKDAAGNALASNYSWSFATGVAPDTTPPTVSSTSPANNAMGIAVNSAITAIFSETMDSSTVTTSTFTLKQGTTAIAGTVTYNGTTATFTPSSSLSYSTTYTATVATGVKDAAGNTMASNYTWSFTTGAAPDTTPPTVSSTNPANNATGVAINSAITATFSESMDTSTITTSTISLKQGTTPVPGAVTYNGTTATFTPSSSLSYSTTYTATITIAVKDAAGNGMASNYSWSFTTGVAPDTMPPTVSSTNPTSNATGIAVNSAITATFSETMNSSTVTTATCTLKQGATTVAGTVTYSGTTATFTPSSNLSYSTTYTVTITTGVKDAAGNAMASNFTWSFTTGTAPDTTPPTISSTSPVNNATGVAINSAITATFSETMDSSTVTTSTFTLKQGTTAIAGTVTYTGTTATFTPSSNLSYSTTYTVTITTGVKDAAGNAMANSYTWTFTTGTTHFKMPDTRQTWSYTTTFGEDNDYTVNPPSYTDNGNSTIRDNVTGLVWQKQDDGGVPITWINAIAYCDNRVLGGQTDWRLPSRMELLSIVDYGYYNPRTSSINPTFFPGTITSHYWSSTMYANSTWVAWVVNFYDGSAYYDYKSTSNYVRCVRGGQ